MNTAFAASHEVSYVVFSFPFIAKYFIVTLVTFSFTLWLLMSVLFNFQVFVNSSDFLLLMVSNCSPFWSENILGIVSILLDLLRLVL